MWFDLTEASVGFIESSPYRFVNEAIYSAPPERVFDVFAKGEGQREWFVDFVENRWDSPEPHGVGTTRVVELKAISVRERFLIWERGKRMTFSIYKSTLPLVSEMLEDLQFEPAKGGGTRFLWRACYRPSFITRPVHPIVRAIFGRMFKKTTEQLGRWLDAHPQ